MSSDLESFVEFLRQQKTKQAPHFPGFGFPAVLSFMATTSLGGSFADCSVNALRAVERGPSERDLRIAIAGPIARLPGRGECVTVHLTRIERYQGYQVKTRALAPGAPPTEAVETAPGGVVVKGEQIYTVHHSPYTLKFFESVPYEEVEELARGLACAIVAVGQTANVSPRFVFHEEVKDGRIALFHGDGLALKTYMNLRANRNETRLVLDLDECSGWLLRGSVDEFAPHQFPEAYERICQGFTAGSWGRPSRVFRFVPDTLRRIQPAR